MNPPLATESVGTATASPAARKALEAAWSEYPPVSVQIGQQRGRKPTANYEATLESAAVDHQRLLGLRAWPRYRVHLHHSGRELVC